MAACAKVLSCLDLGGRRWVYGFLPGYLGKLVRNVVQLRYHGGCFPNGNPFKSAFLWGGVFCYP